MRTRFERTRAVILGAKLVLAVAEVILGSGLLVSGFVHTDLSRTVARLATHELAEDPGDLIARRAILVTRGLHPRSELAAGTIVLVYGVLKGGILVAVLRNARRAALLGAVMFGTIALASLVVLLLRFTPGRLVLGLLDMAVAVVLWMEVRARLVTGPSTQGRAQ